ncbi:MAG: hypothetical protein NC237_08035, partial [Eubacterium sp.]|nr:hypothetical protein [Eubacterium sp.]
MNDEEKLSRAKAGDEYAYGLLCNDSADGLYAVAVLTLNRPDDASEAVKNAFRDGFASIDRIRDKAHLRAWLARELTKYLVARIKEYRAAGVVLPEEDAFSRLPSLDRIVCALRFTFRYNAREIALITGLKEEAVERKLNDSDRRLGKNKAEVLMRIAGIKLPDALKTPELPKEEKLKKLTVPSVAEHKKKREGAAPSQNKDDEDGGEKTSEPTPDEGDAGVKEPLSGEKPEPALNARTFIGVISGQKIKGKDFLALMGNTRISNEVYREIRENPDLTKERLIELLESSPLTSEDYYKLLSAVKRRNELVERRERANRDREEAGLFSLDHKKDEEKSEERAKETPAERFARTEVTKAIPAARADGSSAAKADARSALNRKAKPTKPTDVAKPDVSKTGPFRPIVNTAVLNRLSEDTAVLDRLAASEAAGGSRGKKPNERLSEKRLERLGEKAAEKGEEKPLSPKKPEPIGAEDKKRPAEPIPSQKKSAAVSAPASVPAPEQPRLESVPGKPETAFRPAPPVFDGDDEVDEIDEADEPLREKYKGKEFFLDDDVYYRGVNNGKLAFCAVCAVLLFAGSFAIRLLTTGSPLPSDQKVELEPPAEAIVI